MIFLKRSQSNPSYLNSIFGTLVLFWSTFFVLNLITQTPAQSLIATFISGFIALSFLVFKLKGEMAISQGFSFFILIVFFLRVTLGVTHYLVAMDSAYFSSNTPEFDYLYDHSWLLDWMSKMSNDWKEYWFGYLRPSWFIEKNTGLMPYFSLMYYLGGNEHFLNLTVVNSFHNILVAVLVSRLAFYNLGFEYTKSVFIIALIHPFGLFSSIAWRDSVGQFFLVAGALMIFQYRANFFGMLKPIVGISLIMMLRNIYIFTGFFVLAVQVWLFTKGKYFLRILIFGFSIFFIILLNVVFQSVIESIQMLETGSLNASKGPVGLITGIVKGIVGPFPWTQIFDSNINGYEYLLADILQAIFTQTILIMFVFACLKRQVLFTYLNLSIMTFTFSVMLMGLLGYGFVSYVSLPALLLLAVIPRLSLIQFFKVYGFLFLINFGFGVVWNGVRYI